MRRLLALLAVTALGLAGCATPAGTDGNLANQWPAMPPAAAEVPAVGQCLTGGQISAFEPAEVALRTVDCASEHTLEVVTVGTFAGAEAAAADPPAWDSAATRAAYTACDKATAQYLGGDWRVGRLFPHLALPRRAAWQGGARHHVCGIAEAADDFFSPLARTGSVKGGLAGARPLALTCVLLSGADVSPEGFYGEVKSVKPVDCAEPHDTEFVGVYTAPSGSYPSAQRLKQLAGDGCYAKIASFLGISQTQLYERGDVYTFWTGLMLNQWRIGDRTAHCYLNVSSKKPLRGSVKGLGTKPLPFA